MPCRLTRARWRRSFRVKLAPFTPRRVQQIVAAPACRAGVTKRIHPVYEGRCLTSRTRTASRARGLTFKWLPALSPPRLGYPGWARLNHRGSRDDRRGRCAISAHCSKHSLRWL